MTRPVSFGNNTQGSSETFFEKKVYYERVFPEDLIPNHMSLWDDNRIYGRVNIDNEIIALRESALSPLRGTKGGAAMFALGFVADAFADLRDKMKAAHKHLHELTKAHREEVKKRIEASDIDYFDKPYRRFIGSKFEQETFFVEDPNGNVLEIKTMSNPEVLFETAS